MKFHKLRVGRRGNDGAVSCYQIRKEKGVIHEERTQKLEFLKWKGMGGAPWEIQKGYFLRGLFIGFSPQLIREIWTRFRSISSGFRPINSVFKLQAN